MNAYKFRMSDWSLNVCSSYLAAAGPGQHLEQLAHTRIACLMLRVAITGNGLLARAQVSHHHACRGLEVTVVPGCLFLDLAVEAARGVGGAQVHRTRTQNAGGYRAPTGIASGRKRACQYV